MKQLKVIGLAALAVAAVMAMVGVSSAAAEGPTSLCKIKTAGKCEPPNQYPSGTVLKGSTAITPTFASREPAKLVTNLATVECDSSVEGKTTAETGTTSLPGEITSLTFTNCEITNKEKCTVGTTGNGVANNLPYASSITTEKVEGDGSLTATAHAGGGNPGAFLKCGTIINCTFSTASATLPVHGGNAMVANAEAVAIALTSSGGTCPTTAKWTAKYWLETPSPVFVGM